MKIFKMRNSTISFVKSDKIGMLAVLFFALLFFFVTPPSFCAQRNFFDENTAYTIDKPVIREEITTFEKLGLALPISLKGNLAQFPVGFGSRIDELVTAAKIDVIYTYSPALSPDISHVRVLINNQIAGYFPVELHKAGIPIKNTLQFDPRFLSKYNEITFELVAYSEKECANTAQQSMWFDISNQSTLTLTVQSMAFKNDLSIFPKPFFDVNDFSAVEVPFIFPENAHNEILEAAGITASYLGSLANWREMYFPVLINQLPKKHGIVFATNDKRPDFIKDLPPVNAPTVQLITHPTNPFIKLLLVLGRDKADLRKAMEGLATGSAILTGSFAEVTQIKDILPRQPYDAPNWIPTNREVKLGELIQLPTELQSKGRTPRPIVVNFNISPDLFTWRSRGIPLNLKYRYSPPNKEDDSQLSVKINDLFVKGFTLNKTGISQGSEDDRIRIPLVDALIFGDANEVLLPGFRLGAKNRIQFEYEFTKPNGGDCREITPNYMYGEIDADSTLDLSDFPHYLAMPDLKAFSHIGFPFTRLADLADTAIIMNKNASTSEVETYLNLMGLFGSSTGLTATKFTVANTAPFEGIENKDLLVIGYLSKDIMQRSDTKDLFQIMVTEIKKTITLPIRGDTEFTGDFQPQQLNVDRIMSKQVEFNNQGEMGALIGFESPWQKNRSVIAVVASEPAAFNKITAALMKKVHKIFGSVALFRGDDVTNIQVGETYYVGQLSIIKLISFELSDNPVLLGFLTFVMIVLIIVVLWRLLKYIAYLRLHRDYE